jgi:ribosomal 50S subunit-recycling heat shock protein
MKLLVEENNVEKRLDHFVSENTDISRSQVTKLIKEGSILVNGKKTKTGYMTRLNDEILVEFTSQEMEAKPEKMDLDIVYEDEDVIVVNKANGVVVHPAPGNYTGTLVNGLLYHFKNLSSVNGELRPGIVHRIDADTTGLLMIAKNDKAHEKLAKQLEEKTTHRKYYFGKNLYIERSDFEIVPPPKYRRLFVGNEVRLNGAYIVKCTGYDTDANGNVTTVYAEYDPETRSGTNCTKKVKGTIHWLNQKHVKNVEVRLFENLTLPKEETSLAGGKEQSAGEDQFNPNSLTILIAAIQFSTLCIPAIKISSRLITFSP